MSTIAGAPAVAENEQLGSDKRFHPRAAVSARMTADEFRTLMGRSQPRSDRGKSSFGNAARRKRDILRALKPARANLELPASFTLPFIPPSVNALFHSVRDSESGRPKRVLTRKARRVRKAIKQFVRGSLDPEAIYELHVRFELPALTKGGKIRKVDVSNRIKFLEDCIADCLDIDDRLFFRVILEKYHAEHERTIVTLNHYREERGRRAA